MIWSELILLLEVLVTPVVKQRDVVIEVNLKGNLVVLFLFVERVVPTEHIEQIHHILIIIKATAIKDYYTSRHHK